jgi:glycogen debranching enzyme
MELLTPLGVRTLGPHDPGYQGKHEGNIVSRDRARHNGSAFPWLLGPLASAYLRVHGRTPDALQRVRNILEPSLRWLRGDGLGCIPELFDGNSPTHPAPGQSHGIESPSAGRTSDSDPRGNSDQRSNSDRRSDSDLDALIGAHAVPAQAAQRPGGAIASAVGVAELLRSYREDILGIAPGAESPADAHATVSQ